MAKMRVVQVTRPNGAFEIVEREIPEPGAGSVRIKVEACGICHSDSMTKEGTWPGIQYPRVPGHEIAGVVDAVGAGVEGWAKGQRAGVGWHGGHCGYCDSCRHGDGAAAGSRDSAHPGKTLSDGLAFRQLHRFAGHALVQPAHRRARYDGSFSAGARGRRLRTHDERQGAVSSGPHHRVLMAK
jgi:Zn-dependent alcohol dehydrogenase